MKRLKKKNSNKYRNQIDLIPEVFDSSRELAKAVKLLLKISAEIINKREDKSIK